MKANEFTADKIITTPIATIADIRKWATDPTAVDGYEYPEIDLIVSVPLIDLMEAKPEEVFNLVEKLVIDENSPYSLENWLCPLFGSVGNNVLLNVFGHIVEG